MEKPESSPTKIKLSEKEMNGIRKLQEQIKELSGKSRLADKIVKGLVSAFKPDDDTPDAFDQLIELVTWLYVEDLKGEKLTAKFKEITKTDKVNVHSLKTFIERCYVLIAARHRKEDVATIMKTLSSDIEKFTGDRTATFNDAPKLFDMINTIHTILEKHISFSFDPLDTGRRAGFACYIILHEKTACDLLTEYVKRNKLDESPEYKDLKTRKVEEVRILLQDVGVLDLASMADKL